MNTMEERLVAGLISRIEGPRSEESWIATFAELLRKSPAMIGDGRCLSEQQSEAWAKFRASEQGERLLKAVRYRICWRDKREAARLAQWLSSQPQLCGRGHFNEVASPVEVVEWQWPLSVAVMPDDGYSEAAASIANVIESGPSWMKVLLRHLTGPADLAAPADILVFPQGWAARDTLLKSRAPVTADLLVLCESNRVPPEEIADRADLLLRYTQANAVLALDSPGGEMSWLIPLIEQLAHDEPLDVAVAQALGSAQLLATLRFIERARLSTFAKLVAGRLDDLDPEEPIEVPVNFHTSIPDRMPPLKAAEFFRQHVTFDSENQGASATAAVAAALAPSKVRERGLSESPPRFLQHDLTADEATNIQPSDAFEAGKRYKLEVYVGFDTTGSLQGQAAFPAPPLGPGEKGSILAVVFFEKNSKPEAELGTLFLPQIGTSNTCEFRFTVSDASNLFEGWVSVYHNNRLLQEGVLRARVDGGSGAGGLTVPAKTAFSICSTPRPMELGLVERRLFGGTIRLDSDGAVTATRGNRTQRFTVSGLKDAVEGFESDFDKVPWEDLGTEWIKSKKAATQLSIIAQQGSMLRDALCESSLFQEIEDSGYPVLVYAADANVRLPLELCYSISPPKSTAKVCPESAVGAANGKCPENCDGRKHPDDYVCPMAFWSLSRVIEWRSQAADSRDTSPTAESANEPTSGRRTLKPLTKLLVARSEKVTDDFFQPLAAVLEQWSREWEQVQTWDEWAEAIKKRPSMLLLMPHVENTRRPPLMEIRSEIKNPPNVKKDDVIGDPPQQPLALILGCGAATALVDFQSLPAQFRRKQAAVVLAPIAEILAEDAPKIAQVVIETIAKGPAGTRPLGDVVLAAKRRLVAEGKLAGLLLLAFGDADWLV